MNILVTDGAGFKLRRRPAILSCSGWVVVHHDRHSRYGRNPIDLAVDYLRVRGADFENTKGRPYVIVVRRMGEPGVKQARPLANANTAQR